MYSTCENTKLNAHGYFSHLWNILRSSFQLYGWTCHMFSQFQNHCANSLQMKWNILPYQASNSNAYVGHCYYLC